MRKSALTMWLLFVGLLNLSGDPLLLSDCEAVEAKIRALHELTSLVRSDSLTDPQGTFDSLYTLGIFFFNEYPELCPNERDKEKWFESCFRLTVEVARKYPSSIPPYRQIHAMKNHAKAYYELGLFDLSIRSFQSIWNENKLWENGEEKPSLDLLQAKADVLQEWGRAYLLFDKELYKAAGILRRGWDIYTELIDQIEDPDEKLAEIYYQGYLGNILGQVLANIDNYQEAEIYYSKTLELIEVGIEKDPDLRDLKDEVIINQASMYSVSGSIKKARKSYEKIVERSELKRKLAAVAYTNLGIVYRAEQAYQKAERSLKLAEELYINEPEQLADVYDNLGDVYRDQGRLSSALHMYHRALQADIPSKFHFGLYELPSDSTDFSHTHIRYFLRSLGAKADVLFELSQEASDSSLFFLEKAGNTYRYALHTIDSLQRYTVDPAFKEFLNKEVYDIYEGGIRLASSMKNPETAFNIITRSRANFLLSTLEKLDPEHIRGVSKEHILRERFIRQKLLKFENQLSLDPDESHTRDSLISYQVELDKLVQALKKDPQNSYFNLRFNQNTCSLSDIQHKLRPNTSLIQYFVGNKGAYACQITKQHIEVIPIAYSDSLVGEFLKLIQNDFGGTDTEFRRIFQEIGTSLYETLLGSFQKSISDTLIIIPDGKLSYLPFEALPTEDLGSYDVNESFAYAIYDHSISYSHTACLLGDDTEKLSPALWGDEVLGIAPSFAPLSEGDLKNGDKSFLFHELFASVSELFYSQGRVDELPNREELQSIGRSIRLKAFVGKEALLGRFLNEVDKFPLIHLSTHGSYNDQDPNKNFLQFTPVIDSINNEFLLARMLFGISMNAHCVVMSACQTQQGQINRGEGLMSMAYAFSYAGAKSTVATLWTIRFDENAIIMSDFYKNIKQGMKKAEALRKAKIDYLATEKGQYYPYYWAAPILTGDPSAVYSSTKEGTYFIYLLLLCIFTFWVVKYLKKRGNLSPP